MSRNVTEEKANGKIIESRVLNWQTAVEKIQESAEELSPSCSCIQRLPIPNPVSRFRIGRNAAKKAERVTKLAGTGMKYLSEGIAHPPPVQNMPKPDTTFEVFPSREDAYKKLWYALVNEDSLLICGIYGMAGVGKTRMMENFWEDAMKEKKIFDKVVRVNVGSENLKEVDLQDKIAGCLDCKLESQDVERRASQLENSFKNGRKILLILDDVWREICLDKIIGTPFGDNSCSSKGSKILLTSREKEVCLHNKCGHLVEIETLKPDEALDLFKKAVGPDTINDLQDESLVQNVCDECGHLPLVIHAVGKALKGKSRNLWTDAHNQLMEGKFEKIDGVDPRVYTGIKLSIDYLQNDDAKSCLFLCSMFPEDANIDMKMLIQLATGSQLIPDGEVRILAMVDSLKTSSLLLDSGEDDEIKVHDIIRDVARSVASTDSKYAFLHVKCNSKYFPSDDSYCTGKFLRLDAETNDVHFDEDLVCPDLHTLWLQCNKHPQQFSGGFFSMFANLSCLMLQKVNISLEQFSLQPLGKLGTLTLIRCDISKTDVSLFPKNLKTLCICFCDLPRPLDVANLKKLRKLEIQQQREPQLVMVSNVISSLSSLEELHIPNGFIIDPEEEYRMEPIVMEISKLTHLTSLRFNFYDDDTFQGTNIFSNIDRYHILVGDRWNFQSWDRDLYDIFVGDIWNFLSWTDIYDIHDVGNRKRENFRFWDSVLVPSRRIEFRGNNSQSWEGLMARAEEVGISTSDVEVSSICNGHTRAFQDLKRLYIERCDKMGHLASKSQDEIQYSLQSPACFPKLTILYIESCSKLKYLFCNNIAKSLGQLRQLCVEDCESIEAIIMNEGTSDGEIINFPKLTILYIESCSKLKYLFCNNIAKSLGQLQQLSVKWCDSMEAIIMNEGTSDGEITDDGILFPRLTDLHLERLGRLTSFWCYQSGKASTCKVPLRLPQLSSIVLKDLPHLKSFFHGANFEFHMPALKEVTVSSCGLSILFTYSVFREIRQLERLYVSNCESLELIVEEVGGDETSGINGKSITSSQLSSIALEYLPNLKSFSCTSSYVLNMPKLKNFSLIGCPQIEYFSSPKTNTSLVRVTYWWSGEGIPDLADDIGPVWISL